jgi:triphosphoribosyl-dephospho-CoA synthase
MAAAYDDVALQYENQFADVFELAGNLAEQIPVSGDWKIAVADVHIARLTRGDTLVRRKCGIEIESEMQSRARAAMALRYEPVLNAKSVESLDAWLRADGNRRNPGTTADLITAALFVGLFDGTIEIPAELPDQIAQFIGSNQSPGTMGK